MQDPSLYSQIKAQVTQPESQPQFPGNEHLKCPRCDSTNTKFCYYNNYNLSQPRHYCKNCKRYWTKGGALRNIPVGGVSRRNTKRSSPSSSPATSAVTKRPVPADPAPESDDKGKNGETLPLVGERFGGQFGNLMEVSGGFGSLLAGGGEGQFGNLLDGLGDLDPGQNVDPQVGSDEFLNMQGGGEGSGETGCWSGSSNSWPDLSIYTPGSTFQ